MKAELIRIGNSRGLRLPRKLLELYGMREGDELELEERREGILLRPGPREAEKLGWEAAYREMADELADRGAWLAWDELAGEGLVGDSLAEDFRDD
jgi:antitoxin MazE